MLQSSSSGGPSAFGPIVAIDRITSTNSGAGQTGGDVFFVGAGAGQYTQLSDLIIIGHNALSAGTAGTPVTDANLAGTIVIGSGAASVLTSATGQGGIGQNGPNTVIGFNALHTAINCNSSTVIGSNAFAQYNNPATLQQFGANVFIGESVGKNVTPTFGGNAAYESVVIGYLAASAPVSGQGGVDIGQTVVIGWKACGNFVGTGGGTGIDRCVVIGAQAASGVGDTNNDNVIIGFSAGAGIAGSSRNVYIGTDAKGGDGVTPDTDNVAIGSANNTTGVFAGVIGNVVIGAGASNSTSSNCILLGVGCGSKNTQPISQLDGQLLFETVNTPITGTRSAILYGRISSASPGGLVVGHSTPGVDRDIPGFNILKLINGSKTGVSPLGGGFLYSSAGALHWMGTSGTDTTIAVA